MIHDLLDKIEKRHQLRATFPKTHSYTETTNLISAVRVMAEALEQCYFYFKFRQDINEQGPEEALKKAEEILK